LGLPEAFGLGIQASDIEIDLTERMGLAPQEDVIDKSASESLASARGAQIEIDDLAETGLLKESGAEDLGRGKAKQAALLAGVTQDKEKKVWGGHLLEKLASEIDAGEGLALEMLVKASVFVHEIFPQG